MFINVVIDIYFENESISSFGIILFAEVCLAILSYFDEFLLIY